MGTRAPPVVADAATVMADDAATLTDIAMLSADVPANGSHENFTFEWIAQVPHTT